MRSQLQTPPNKTRIPVHIRWMIRRDTPEVLDIEEAGFGDHGWSEEELVDALRQRNVIGMVAEHRELVVGFMVYEIHANRLRVLNFAVHPHYRRGRVGEQMLEKLKSKLTPMRRNKITVAVRETNLEGQLFFRAMGFRAIKVIRAFFGADDAYVMQHRHVAAEPPAR